MKIQKIKVDGINYLGTLEDNVISGVTTPHFEDYLKAKAKGDLITVTVGDNKNLVITDFTDAQRLDFKRTKSLWKLAKKQTTAYITCDIFDRLVGGKK